VLGAMLEENFISSMIKADGKLAGFFERPIALGLAITTLVVFVWPLTAWLWRYKRSLTHGSQTD